MLWVRISIRARCTTLCDKVCQWLAGRWISPGPPVSSTNETDCHDITELLLKVTWNTIKQTNKQTNKQNCQLILFLHSSGVGLNITHTQKQSFSFISVYDINNVLRISWYMEHPMDLFLYFFKNYSCIKYTINFISVFISSRYSNWSIVKKTIT